MTVRVTANHFALQHDPIASDAAGIKKWSPDVPFVLFLSRLWLISTWGAKAMLARLAHLAQLWHVCQLSPFRFPLPRR